MTESTLDRLQRKHWRPNADPYGPYDSEIRALIAAARALEGMVDTAIDGPYCSWCGGDGGHRKTCNVPAAQAALEALK